MQAVEALFSYFYSPSTEAPTGLWSVGQVEERVRFLSKELLSREKEICASARHYTSFWQLIKAILEKKPLPSALSLKDCHYQLQLFLLVIDPSIRWKENTLSEVLQNPKVDGPQLIVALTNEDIYPPYVRKLLLPYFSQEQILAAFQQLPMSNRVMISLDLACCFWETPKREMFFSTFFSRLTIPEKDDFFVRIVALPDEERGTFIRIGGTVATEWGKFERRREGYIEKIKREIENGGFPHFNYDKELRFYLLMRLHEIYKTDVRFATLACSLNEKEWHWLKEQHVPIPVRADSFHQMVLIQANQERIQIFSTLVLSWISHVATVSLKYPSETSSTMLATFYGHAKRVVAELGGWRLISEETLCAFAGSFPPSVLAAYGFDTFDPLFFENVLAELIREHANRFQEFVASLLQNSNSSVFLSRLFDLLERFQLSTYAVPLLNRLESTFWTNLLLNLQEKHQLILLKEFLKDSSGQQQFAGYLVSHMAALSDETFPKTTKLFSSLREKLSQITPTLPKEVARELRATKTTDQDLLTLANELELTESEANDPRRNRRKAAIATLNDLCRKPFSASDKQTASNLVRDLNLVDVEIAQALFRGMSELTWPRLFFFFGEQLSKMSLDVKTVSKALSQASSIRAPLARESCSNSIFSCLITTDVTKEVFADFGRTASPRPFMEMVSQFKKYREALPNVPSTLQQGVFQEILSSFLSLRENKADAVATILYEWTCSLEEQWQEVPTELMRMLLAAPLTTSKERGETVRLLSKKENFFTVFLQTPLKKELLAVMSKLEGFSDSFHGLIQFILLSVRFEGSAKLSHIKKVVVPLSMVYKEWFPLLSAENPYYQRKTITGLIKRHFDYIDLSSEMVLRVLMLEEDVFVFLVKKIEEFGKKGDKFHAHLENLLTHLVLIDKKEEFESHLIKDTSPNGQAVKQELSNHLRDCCNSGPLLLALSAKCVPNWKEAMHAVLQQVSQGDHEEHKSSSPQGQTSRELDRILGFLRQAKLLTGFEEFQK